MKSLRKMRRALGLTQHALEAASGIARWKICHAELGLRQLTELEENVIRKVLVKVRKKSERVLQAVEEKPVA